jgi:hypothetical protein
MESQIAAFAAFLSLMCFGIWLMFGRLGNKKPSGDDAWAGPSPPNDAPSS